MEYSSGNYILILANGFPSDNCLGGIFEMDQAKALHHTGEHVIFLALDLRSIRHKRKLGIKKFHYEGILCYKADLPLGNVPLGLFRLFGSYALKKAYKQIVRENGTPKLIHAHFTDMGYLVGMIKKKTAHIGLVLTEHSSAINKAIIDKKTWKMAQKAYSAADMLIAVSSALRTNMRRVTEKDIVVIPNIVDLSSFPQFDRQVYHDEYRFISVGNLIEIKNYEVLIRSFQLACLEKDDISLDIIGGGPEYQKLNAIIRDLNMENKIRLLGRKNRREIAELFYGSDAFVLLSKAETFGVSFIEAMSCGLAVISSRCGGPEDFVTEQNGILVPIDDIVASSKALIEIRTKKYDRQSIKNYVIDNFSEQVIADKLLKLYAEQGN